MQTTTNQFVETATKYVSEMLAHLGLPGEFQIKEDDNVVGIHITTTRDDLLSGRSSEPLLALQHLARIMLRTAFPDSTTSVSLDVGDYQERQLARLSELAKNAAAQVRATGLAVHLPDMSSYERRLVHMTISEETGVVSESEGVGAGRRIVIKPQT